jgi:glc operon protein GlcG
MTVTLPSKPRLTLEAAKAIGEAAEQEARRRGHDRLSIAVVGDSGHLFYFVRQDAGEPVSAEIAIAKARAAAIYTKPTRHWNEVLMSGKNWVLNMPQMAAVGGGVPVVVDGHVVAGVGVAGATGIADDEIASVGAAAVAG